MRSSRLHAARVRAAVMGMLVLLQCLPTLALPAEAHSLPTPPAPVVVPSGAQPHLSMSSPTIEAIDVSKGAIDKIIGNLINHGTIYVCGNS